MMGGGTTMNTANTNIGAPINGENVSSSSQASSLPKTSLVINTPFATPASDVKLLPTGKILHTGELLAKKNLSSSIAIAANDAELLEKERSENIKLRAELEQARAELMKSKLAAETRERDAENQLKTLEARVRHVRTTNDTTQLVSLMKELSLVHEAVTESNAARSAFQLIRELLVEFMPLHNDFVRQVVQADLDAAKAAGKKKKEWAEEHKWASSNTNTFLKGDKNPSADQVAFARATLLPPPALPQLTSWSCVSSILNYIRELDNSGGAASIYFLIDLRERDDMPMLVERSRVRLQDEPWRPNLEADFDKYLEFLRRIFYVGKNLNTRLRDHITIAQSSSTRVQHCEQRIRHLWNDRTGPFLMEVTGLTTNTAASVEAALIDLLISDKYPHVLAKAEYASNAGAYFFTNKSRGTCAFNGRLTSTTREFIAAAFLLFAFKNYIDAASAQLQHICLDGNVTNFKPLRASIADKIEKK